MSKNTPPRNSLPTQNNIMLGGPEFLSTIEFLHLSFPIIIFLFSLLLLVEKERQRMYASSLKSASLKRSRLMNKQSLVYLLIKVCHYSTSYQHSRVTKKKK